MKRLFRELILFIVFTYLAVGICVLVLSVLDLRSYSQVISQIDEIFLIQLSVFIWFISLLSLYLLRVLTFYFYKKFSSEA
jgi:hypothetical protein